MQQVSVDAEVQSALHIVQDAVAAAAVADGAGVPGASGVPAPPPEAGRRRQWRVHCATCGGLRAGSQAKRMEASRACASCGHSVHYRQWIYRCTACTTVVCKHCASAQHRQPHQSQLHDAEAQDVAGTAAPAPPAAVLDAAAGPAAAEPTQPVVPPDLLLLLRRLPDAFPRAPRIWVPRALKQQVGSVLTTLIRQAAECAGAEPGDGAAELQHRLCRAAPQLLLRAAPEDAAQEHPDEQAHGAASSLAVLRGRVRAAVRGEWAGLVQDLLGELEADRARAAPGPPAASRDAEGRLTAAAAQAATMKVRNGSKRGGADILTSGKKKTP